MLKRFAFGFFGLTLALLAAPHARANSFDPCTLVTQSEAATAMGTAASPGKEEKMSGGNACRYMSADKSKSVFVHVVPVAHVTGASQMGGTALSGIGDKAYFLAGSIFFQKGGQGLQVTLYPPSQTAQPAAISLAKTAASRM